MAQSNKSIQQLLAEPFDPFDIEWRIQSAGRQSNGKVWAVVIPYITNRGIQERLDEVCGIDGWRNEFTETPNGKGILCGISIKFQSKGVKPGDAVGTKPEYEWITKWDGAEETAVEAVKGGLSSAMKRAAVQWGIGRYLYRLEAAIINPLDKQPDNMADYLMARSVKIEGKKTHLYYKRPNLPSWAIPKAEDEHAEPSA